MYDKFCLQIIFFFEHKNWIAKKKFFVDFRKLKKAFLNNFILNALLNNIKNKSFYKKREFFFH